jgi:hypothetical protein
VIFNEAKLTYKNSDQKTLVDSPYSGDEMNDPFQSVRDDQSVKEPLTDENFQQNQEKVTPPAESLQPVKDSQKTAYQADNQAASTHAAEAEITPADNSDAEHFVLVNELEDQTKMINQADQSVADQAANEAELVADNQLISEKHNPLILNYPRPKIRHDYKQLHRRGFTKSAKQQKGFVKSAKFEPRHDLITPKTFEEVINEPQTKE